MEAATVTRMETAPKDTPEIVAVDLETVEYDLEELPQGDGRAADMARVDFFLSKIAEQHEKLTRAEAVFDERVRPIVEWRERERASVLKAIKYFEIRARSYLPLDGERFRKEFGAKSLKLPSGELGYAKSRERVEITDEVLARAFACEHGIPVTEKVTYTVSKVALRDYVQSTGLAVDAEENGFFVVPAEERFYVTPGGGR